MIFRGVYHYDHFEFLPLIVLFIPRNTILLFNSTINIFLEVRSYFSLHSTIKIYIIFVLFFLFMQTIYVNGTGK